MVGYLGQVQKHHILQALERMLSRPSYQVMVREALHRGRKLEFQCCGHREKEAVVAAQFDWIDFKKEVQDPETHELYR